MKLELPLFVDIPKTGPNPPIIIDYDEQLINDENALYNNREHITEMIDYLIEHLYALTRVPRRFLNNDNE